MTKSKQKNKNKKFEQVPIKQVNKLKQEILALRARQPAPKKNPRPPKQNSTNHIREMNDVPLGNNQKSGFNRNAASKTLSKEEFIADISGTQNFAVRTYSVNPGQKSTFPWLSIESAQWEKYEFEYLEFYLKPQVTQYSTNANTGKIILSLDTDASDAPPGNKREAEDILPMADGMPYQSVSMRVPGFILKRHLDSFYVRTGALPGGADIKTYDLGNLFVTTLGQGGAVPNMSELWVRYRVRMMVPILEEAPSAPICYTVSAYRDTKPVFNVGDFSYTPTWTTLVVVDGLKLPNDGGIFTLPKGNYVVSCNSFFDSSGTASGSGIQQASIGIYKDGTLLEANDFRELDWVQTATIPITPFFISSDGTNKFNVLVKGKQNTGLLTVYSDLCIQSV